MQGRNRSLERFMMIRYAVMMLNITVSIALIIFIVMRFIV